MIARKNETLTFLRFVNLNKLVTCVSDLTSLVSVIFDTKRFRNSTLKNLQKNIQGVGNDADQRCILTHGMIWGR